MHPGRLGCENLVYADFPAFSRLAGQTPQRLKLRSYFFLEVRFGDSCVTEPCSSHILFSFRSQMTLFRNSPPASGQVGVNRRNRLCGVHAFASAQFLDFLELADNRPFLDRKRISALYETADGHHLILAHANRAKQRFEHRRARVTLSPPF
jgi:hypothetical protein